MANFNWNSDSNNNYGVVAQEVGDVFRGMIQMYAPNENAGITLHANNKDEMLKITPEGFYVRGVKIPQDEHEAQTVYLAFKQWLAWANIQRR